MKDVKYIAFENEFGNDDLVIFSNQVIHSEMARNRRIFREVTGAGFIRIGADTHGVTVHCYGKSESLGVESRGEIDSNLA
jgi:hypothetical protein